MSVVARFFVAEITQYAGNEGGRVVLKPVVRPTPDNVAWSKYTPSGSFEMNVTQPSAFGWFAERRGRDVAIMIGDPSDVVLADLPDGVDPVG